MRGSQYLLRARVTSLAIRKIRKTIDRETYVQNEVDVMRKQLRGREGAHYISSARPHHACCWLSLFGSWAPSLNSAGPFPHLVQCDTVRAKRGWARSSAYGYDGRVWQLLRIAPGAGSHPMARTRSKMRQGRALAVDSLFWHREASRERRVACIVVNGTKWANAIAPLPEQLPDVDGTHVQVRKSSLVLGLRHLTRAYASAPSRQPPRP